MTEPKKTTRRTTRTRSGSTRSAAGESPFEFTTPTEDTSHKVQKAVASLEELQRPSPKRLRRQRRQSLTAPVLLLTESRRQMCRWSSCSSSWFKN